MERSGGGNELDKLRKTIEEFRAKAERNGGVAIPGGHGNVFMESKSANLTPEMGYPSSETGPWSAHSTYSAPALSSGRHYDTLSPNSTIGKRVSSGSLSSMSSHASHSSVSSSSSGGSGESDQKQGKKKRWLPLKSAFSKGSKSSQSGEQHEYNEADDSGCLLSPTSSRRGFHNSSLGSLDEGLIDQNTYNEIMQVVQEKERKLTDVRLEALTSQHQLHQLQDQIVQMQHEMQLLRLENERLQANNGNHIPTNPNASSTAKLRLNLPTHSPFMTSSGLELSAETDATSHFTTGVNSLDCSRLHRLVSPGTEDEGLQIRFVICSPTTVKPSTQQRHTEDILIGSVPVSRKCTWNELDRTTSELFVEYCRCIDGVAKLGLTASSISFYKVGEQTRVPGSHPPDLLPCAFIIGSVDTVEVSLQDASCSSVDLLSFKTLIPKDILVQYLNHITQKKRVILHGPSGTGKSFFSFSLANYLIKRDRIRINKEEALFIYDVKQRGEKELLTYIKELSEKCRNSKPDVTTPHVIIIENCHMLSSLKETFEPLTSPDGKPLLYVIGTTLQGRGNNDEDLRNMFAWINCSNNSAHVKDFLVRYLRRCVVENEINGQQTSEDELQNMLRVITWLPLCWHHVNRCLEEQSAYDVTIGPRVFASCPSDFYASCSWFVQVWNHVIAPYVIAAIRKIRQSQTSEQKKETTKWVDPTQWVIESFPWNVSDMGCDNTLRLKHISGDDLDCPPVPPRMDLTSCRNQTTKEIARPAYPSHAMTMNNPNYIDSFIVDRTADTSLERKNSKAIKKEKRPPPVPPMELMNVRESNSTVWHKHNSPLTSPTKTVIHAGVSRNR